MVTKAVQKNLIHNLAKKAYGRFVLMGLLMLGVLLHAMVPTGFMPTANNGKMTLVICSGMGEKTIVVDADDHTQSNDQTPDNDHQSLSACPYFVAQLAGLYPEQSALEVPFIASIKLSNIQFDRVANTFTLILPPARGPPSLIV